MLSFYDILVIIITMEGTIFPYNISYEKVKAIHIRISTLNRSAIVGKYENEGHC